jgi:hypothetical protein
LDWPDDVFQRGRRNQFEREASRVRLRLEGGERRIALRRDQLLWPRPLRRIGIVEERDRLFVGRDFSEHQQMAENETGGRIEQQIDVDGSASHGVEALQPTDDPRFVDSELVVLELVLLGHTHFSTDSRAASIGKRAPFLLAAEVAFVRRRGRAREDRWNVFRLIGGAWRMPTSWEAWDPQLELRLKLNASRRRDPFATRVSL